MKDRNDRVWAACFAAATLAFASGKSVHRNTRLADAVSRDTTLAARKFADRAVGSLAASDPLKRGDGPKDPDALRRELEALLPLARKIASVPCDEEPQSWSNEDADDLARGVRKALGDL